MELYSATEEPNQVYGVVGKSPSLCIKILGLRFMLLSFDHAEMVSRSVCKTQVVARDEFFVTFIA
jgi:hypothetical protein